MSFSIGKLANRNDCTGCAACVAACNRNALSMEGDEEGFLRPTLDSSKCTSCESCVKACPINQTTTPHVGSIAWAAWNLDPEIRARSSSGGVFTALARTILSRGGHVVGAALDEALDVEHIVVEDEAGLSRLRGSKYVQSRLAPETMKQIARILRKGGTVLFSGTPCQVAAAKGFLPTDRGTLYTCDLVCHGTPSPLLWSRYREHLARKGKPLAGFSFRSKALGWNRIVAERVFRDGSREYDDYDPFMLAFLRNLSLRPSCYSCHFTNMNREGDLTIADFWGVGKFDPALNPDDKGTSLILQNSQAGHNLLSMAAADLFLKEVPVEAAMPGNPMLSEPSSMPPERATFFRDLESQSFDKFVRGYGLRRPGLRVRLTWRLRKLVSRWSAKGRKK